MDFAGAPATPAMAALGFGCGGAVCPKIYRASSTNTPVPANRYCCLFMLMIRDAILHLFVRVWLIFLHRLQLFYLCNKLLRRLERRNVMLRNMNSHILLYVAADFCSPLLRDKTTEPTDIDILSLGQGFFHFFEHGFQRH